MIGSRHKERGLNRKVTTTRQRRRQHLMEVKVRRETARRQNSRKVFGFLFRLCFFTLLIGGAYYGIREALAHFLFENPEYNVRQIDVVVAGDMSRADVLEAAQIKEGGNIFAVDLGGISRRIEALSQVEDVEVERILPNKISIHVEERRPIAWAAPIGAESHPFNEPTSVMLDPRGYALPKSSRTEYVNLPIIWVRSQILEISPGVRIDDEAVQLAIGLLQKVQTAPIGTRFVIQEIDLSKEFCLIARDRSKMSVMFGFDQLDEQLAKLGIMLEHFESMHAKPATINLLVQRNTPVTFAQNVVPVDPAEVPAAEATPTPKKGSKPAKEPPIRRALPVNPQPRKTNRG
nr:POTRA domain, FtsQ-type [uncultured bacterium]